MSNGHIAWNPDSSRSWADMLGLIDVPLFNTTEQATKQGNPTLLQDGFAASFALLTSRGKRLELDDDPLSWSWSSNVRHLLIVDSTLQRMFLRRWDRPSESRQFKTPERGLGAEDLLTLLEGAQPPRTPGVVRHVLSAFRLLRQTLPGNSSLESLQLLNGFLLAAQTAQRDQQRAAAFLAAKTLGEAMDKLDVSDQVLAGVDRLPQPIANLRANALANFFLDKEPRSGCMLYSNLLFRHASSQLYQEAHLEIEREPQGFLPGFAPENEPEGEIPKDVRYTPVNLARSIVQQALIALGDVAARVEPLQILDPACGSGVFLQESLRELLRVGFTGPARIDGYDISQLAVYVSNFCLEHAKLELQSNSSVNFNIELTDSLAKSWVDSDLILMNPPFITWNALTTQQKELLRATLDDAYKGRADLAMAFLLKAVKSLKPGGVVASVLPAALLGTDSGRQLREQIFEIADLVGMGKFEGYTYFKTSFVEPSFVVLRRKESSASASPQVRVVIAKEGSEDKALRLLRISGTVERKEGDRVEIFSVARENFKSGNWMPERQGVYELKARLNRLRFPKVGALFNVRQGIRTGDNAAFILTADEYGEIAGPERRYFRPLAGQGALKFGQLVPSYYVFYPYESDGKPLITSEVQLLKALPTYHEKFLKDRKQKLEARENVKDWWLLTRPRGWQASKIYKLVSTYFGASGSFAYDDRGDYVVVQGYAWLGKSKMLLGMNSIDPQTTLRNTPVPWAYLAILNSKLFELILSSYCPRVQGGQYNLSTRFVADIPIPNLSDAQFSANILRQLAAVGRGIHEGRIEELRDEIDRVAHQAYGLRDDFLSS